MVWLVRESRAQLEALVPLPGPGGHCGEQKWESERVWGLRKMIVSGPILLCSGPGVEGGQVGDKMGEATTSSVFLRLTL